ncbi:hypothetical protein [Actinosynnema sp. NPDC020468]|uniref:hypothetical protein n=1 Tax=Actinosynnema sp. NPDC020468 TaxID=3154488 RepID=UPI0034054C54
MKPLVGMVRAVVLAVVVGVGTWFGAWRFGVPAHWAVLVALPVATLGLLVARLPRATDVLWAPPPEPRSGVVTTQAGTLASRLAEAHEDPSRFGTRIRPRLRALAEARLRHLGITDLADPAARAALGPELHHFLTAPDATLPDPSKLTRLLENL